MCTLQCTVTCPASASYTIARTVIPLTLLGLPSQSISCINAAVPCPVSSSSLMFEDNATATNHISTENNDIISSQGSAQCASPKRVPAFTFSKTLLLGFRNIISVHSILNNPEREEEGLFFSCSSEEIENQRS